MTAAQAHEVGAGATNGTPPASATRPALRVARKPAQALTHAQRAAVAAFAPDARRLARKWLGQRPSFLHLQEDAEGYAYEAICLAAMAWDGVRPFPPLASTYVFNGLQRWLRLAGHVVPLPASAVARGERNAALVPLDGPTSEGRPLSEVLTDAEAPGAEEVVARREAPGVLQALRAHVLGCALTHSRTATQAHRDVGVWWAVDAEGQSATEVARQVGVTKQAVHQALTRLRTYVDAFSREVRHG